VPQPIQTRFHLALETIATLRQHGYTALLVGGCVRDRLLGIPPKDFDIATSAKSTEIAVLFPKAQLVGAHFGVSLLTHSPGVEIEIATFRSEGAYSDGRHPNQVAFVTDPALDAQRRDFTINGLFEDPLTAEIGGATRTGKVLDFVNGQADLQAGLIRAIGDPQLRFHEDHLRMLRAVRFASRLNFQIEPATLAAIRQQAGNISLISAERIRDELTRILTQPNPQRGLQLLDETGLLPHLLPEIKAFQGVQQPPEFHPEGDVWTHVSLMLSHLDHPTPTLAWAVLLHDVAKPATFRITDRIRFDGHAELGATMSEAILARLKFPHDDIAQICSLVANHMKFKDVRKMRLSTLKRFLRLPQFDEHLELHRIDCLCSNGLTDSLTFVESQLAALPAETLRPKPLLTGSDLIAAGFRPGPPFKTALAAVETAQLESQIQTPDEALALARQFLDSK
jgi:poly(A) polymerase